MKKHFLLLLLCGAMCTLSACNTPQETLDWNKKIAATATHCAAVGLGGILATIEGEQAGIDAIRAYVHPVRFYDDQSGYFYVYNYDCVNIAHATQHDLEGQNLYDYQDSHGTYVIRELSAAAQNGGGFVEYYWNNPTTQQEQKKIGYVEPIPDTDYFIGDGVYIE